MAPLDASQRRAFKHREVASGRARRTVLRAGGARPEGVDRPDVLGRASLPSGQEPPREQESQKDTRLQVT